MHKGEMTLLGCGFNGSQKSSIQKKLYYLKKVEGKTQKF